MKENFNSYFTIPTNAQLIRSKTLKRPIKFKSYLMNMLDKSLIK